MEKWGFYPAAEHGERRQPEPKELLIGAWGATGARERPEVGHVLLARVPTPPRRWGRCDCFPDEALTPRGKDSPGCPTGTADSSLASPCPPGLLGLWRLSEIGLKERLLRASRRARGVYLGPRPQGRCLLRLRSHPQINKSRPAPIKPDALTRQLANEQGRAPGSTCAPRIRGPGPPPRVAHGRGWKTQAPGPDRICHL